MFLPAAKNLFRSSVPALHHIKEPTKFQDFTISTSITPYYLSLAVIFIIEEGPTYTSLHCPFNKSEVHIQSNDVKARHVLASVMKCPTSVLAPRANVHISVLLGNQAYSSRICAASIKNSKICMSLYPYLNVILFFYHTSFCSLS